MFVLIFGELNTCPKWLQYHHRISKVSSDHGVVQIQFWWQDHMVCLYTIGRWMKGTSIILFCPCLTQKVQQTISIRGRKVNHKCQHLIAYWLRSRFDLNWATSNQDRDVYIQAIGSAMTSPNSVSVWISFCLITPCLSSDTRCHVWWKLLMRQWLRRASKGHEMYCLWTGGHEFEPWSDRYGTWGAYIVPLSKSYLNQNIITYINSDDWGEIFMTQFVNICR